MKKGLPTKMPSLTAPWARGLVCLFFVAVLALGLLTAGDYGSPWDEPDEMDILRMNVWEYARAFGRDEAPFQEVAATRQQDTASGQLERPLTPISQSIERDHGQSAYYPLAPLVMDSSLAPGQTMGLWHAYTWLLFWLGGVGLYLCCRLLGLSRPMGCGAVLMLLLSPRFFAEGHYNNKDIVLMALTLLMLWQALALMKRPTFLRGLLFSLMGALAANTKIAGLALWGLCGLGVLLHLGLQKRLNHRSLVIGLCSLLAFGAFYGLLTPALWQDPWAYLSYSLRNAMGFTRWEHLLLFRGTVFDTATQALPWYYLPYMILVTTPLWILLLLGVGQVVALARAFQPLHRESRVPLLLCTALWLVPLLFAVLTGTVVYNGWRHFYFLYGPMILLAAYGFHWFWAHTRHQVAKNQALLRRLSALLLILCMALTGADMALNHPYQYVYYNSLVPKGTINSYLERDYWNVSVLNALQLLAQAEDVQAASSPPTIAGVDLWAQVGVERGLPLLANPGALQAVTGEDGSDYWLANHTYIQLSGWVPEEDMRLATQVSAYGQPLVSIYRRVPGE